MKLLISLSFGTTLLLSANLLAQDTSTMRQVYLRKADTAVLQSFNLDFAVPDIPAFKALGNDPSQVLRPSSPKDIALMVSNFRSGSSFIVPQNFAAEITPGLLFNPWYTLNQYQQDGGIRFLSKLRLSAGSNHNEATGQSFIAFGLRATLQDKGDFRLSQVFLDTAIYRHQDNYTQAWSKNLDAYISKNFRSPEEYATLPKASRDSIIEQVRLSTIEAMGYDLDVVVAAAMTEFKQKHWNATRMDFAYSVMLQSPDNLLGKVSANKHLFWWVWAIRPGKQNNWAQLVLGVNNALYRTGGNFRNAFTGNVRFYAGRNRFKGFVEAQYSNADRMGLAMEKQLYSQVGVEVAVYKSIWFHFGTGVLNALNGSTRSQLHSNLNLYFSFPENFRLF